MGWVQVGTNYEIPCWEEGALTANDATEGSITFPAPWPGHFGIEQCFNAGARVIDDKWKDHCPTVGFGEAAPSPKRFKFQRDDFDPTDPTDDPIFDCGNTGNTPAVIQAEADECAGIFRTCTKNDDCCSGNCRESFIFGSRCWLGIFSDAGSPEGIFN
jgi:hypothetical protein